MKPRKAEFQVLIFNSAELVPERVLGPFPSRADAEQVRDRLRLQCQIAGWAKYIDVRQAPRLIPN